MRAPNRRQLMAMGLAISALSLSESAEVAEPQAETSLLPRLTESSVVSMFVWTLFSVTKPDMPKALSSEILSMMPGIIDTLNKLDAKRLWSPAERRQLGFFAGVSTSIAAPYALRRAGYEDMARACEVELFSEVTHGTAATEHATVTIGHETIKGITPTTLARDSALGACQNAANAKHSFLCGEDRCLTGVAICCAYTFYYVRRNDDGRIDPTADNWVWRTAVAAVNHAMLLT